MSYKLQRKKYKKLLKELIYHRAEIEYQEEILKECAPKWHEEQIKYCDHHNIDLNKINEENQQRLAGLQVSTDAKAKQPKTNNKSNFSKIYKQIARKAHPDKADVDDEELFKAAAMAYHDEDWGKLLEIADELDCTPPGFPRAMLADMQQQIVHLKQKIEVNAKKYGWLYYQCDDDQECIENLIKQMLAHVYNYSVS